MARRQSRRGDESPSSESFRIDSYTSDFDLETDISAPEPPPSSFRKSRSRVSQVGTRGRSRALSNSSSSTSDDEGNYARRRRSRKPVLGKLSKVVSTTQERNSRRSTGSSSSCSDTDGDDSATDPDIESDDTSSDSEDDGYADGTKEMIARMRDRWERYVKH